MLFRSQKQVDYDALGVKMVRFMKGLKAAVEAGFIEKIGGKYRLSAELSAESDLENQESPDWAE